MLIFKRDNAAAAAFCKKALAAKAGAHCVVKSSSSPKRDIEELSGLDLLASLAAFFSRHGHGNSTSTGINAAESCIVERAPPLPQHLQVAMVIPRIHNMRALLRLRAVHSSWNEAILTLISNSSTGLNRPPRLNA
ncbi:hypothetical protein GOP47_0001118 [Adiantum capillus-veneris]|uniref:Uncharacterized protein n=1 Tax=Adiantum capillus-veneris TaxID=13818 RepID=A0A9D4ZQL3_ADICA|nr:hypothetical protein GOP47_0000312 [Adiantum capillus-veneris]KAI5084949.1 hypothetical protein GOP47_0001118 [Adiantum capillus-veneris]